MRNRRAHALVLLLAITAAGCIGTKTRDKALMPAVASAWKGVKADIDKGVMDAKEAGGLSESAEAVLAVQLSNFDAAIAAKDRTALTAMRAHWPVFKTYAERGITRRVKDGEISAGVSQSLLERVRNFEEAFFKLTDR